MNRTIKVNYLSRVEGEGGISIRIRNNEPAGIEMRIFEAPRFFESFLRARPAEDAVDFTARICGICPVAYQMSTVHAMEKVLGLEPAQSVRDLRRLLYCGEWIESHALHVYFLHGPDFYGLESAWSGKEYLPVLKRGIALKKTGNRILSVIGGRSIHPVSVRIGGFHHAPDKETLLTLLPEIEEAYEASLNEIRWAASLPFNGRSLETEYVSLRHPGEYPMNEGTVVSNRGMDIPMDRFPDAIQEYQVNYSTALHSGIMRERAATPYLVGPVARLNNNYDRLPEEILNVMKEQDISLPITNVQMGIVARTIEIAYALYEAAKIIGRYDAPETPYVSGPPKAGRSSWITEAPRGILIHRYELDEKRMIKHCRIIPPTSQNAGHIEKDLSHFIQENPDRPADYLKKESEKIVRGYDPCISCAVHVIRL